MHEDVFLVIVGITVLHKCFDLDLTLPSFETLITNSRLVYVHENV